MRIALCDDNKIQLRILDKAAKNCIYWRDIDLDIDAFTSGRVLMDSVRSGIRYEYILLDIEMPEFSGFDVYQDLSSYGNSSFIFVSAHVRLLPEAFALHPHGFLPKPYDQEIFDKTIKSAIDQNIETQFYQYTFEGVNISIPCREIFLFHIKDYVITMYSTNKVPVILPRKNLDEVELELSSYGFYRCSRSMLINLRYCTGRNDNLVTVAKNSKLNNQIEIEISRRKLREFDDKLILYKMGDKNAF
jgi:DNA-binding LytR/AlgR family response regulator